MAPKQDPIRSMQHVLVDLRYEKAYISNNLIKRYFCNFTLLMPSYLGCPGPSPRLPPPLHATDSDFAPLRMTDREMRVNTILNAYNCCSKVSALLEASNINNNDVPNRGTQKISQKES